MKTHSSEEAAESGGGRFPAEALMEVWDTRCPVCREILHIEQLVSGPKFVCSCVVKGEQGGQSD